MVQYAELRKITYPTIHHRGRAVDTQLPLDADANPLRPIAGGLSWLYPTMTKLEDHDWCPSLLKTLAVERVPELVGIGLARELLVYQQFPAGQTFAPELLGLSHEGFLLLSYLDGVDLEGYSFQCSEGEYDLASRPLHPENIGEWCNLWISAVRSLLQFYGYVDSHNDLKLSNWLALSKNDVRLVDFSFALLADECAFDTILGQNPDYGNYFGTDMYLLPEKLWQPWRYAETYSKWGDAYGLGVAMFESLVGRLPQLQPGETWLEFVLDEHCGRFVPICDAEIQALMPNLSEYYQQQYKNELNAHFHAVLKSRTKRNALSVLAPVLSVLEAYRCLMEG